MNNDASINQTMIFITQSFSEQVEAGISTRPKQSKPSSAVSCPRDRQGRHLNILWLQWKKLHDSNTNHRCHETIQN